MSSNGVCEIKAEYIIHDHVRQLTIDCISEKDKHIIENNCLKDNERQLLENTSEPPLKKPRLSKQEKKKLRGQNKSRPAPFRRDLKLELCNTLVDVTEGEDFKKCTNEKCQFLHDIEEYLKIKPKDIGSTCYNFETRGRCPRGLTCRFGSKHITSDGRNKVDAEKNIISNTVTTINQLTHDLQMSLRKRHYDFIKSENIIKENDKKRANDKTLNESVSSSIVLETNKNNETNNTHTDKADLKIVENNNESEQSLIRSGCVLNEDLIKLQKSEKKTIDWKDKLFLSPLTTVGNLPFRRICKEYGADITCGEMAMSSALLQGASQEWALVKKHHTENLFGVQLCGNNPHVITKSAQVLQEKMQIDFVDLNLGCPIDLIYKEGGGSGLLRRERVLETVVRCTSSIIDVPLTIKTRTGVYINQNIAHKLVPKFFDWGASLVTIHGRSREQRYTRLADWDYIEQCANLVKPNQVFGNGDILSYDDYIKIRNTYTSVSGVTIGRGALIKPWIFTEIKEQRLWDISSSDRFDILKKYTNYGLEHWGSDTKGVENTRRFMLEWLSFLHRYIPVGILERPPQRINERPPFFRGRNDLETLMASSNCADWIKISEMLLGPVPENFTFLPKHKANSYK